MRGWSFFSAAYLSLDRDDLSNRSAFAGNFKKRSYDGASDKTHALMTWPHVEK